MREDFNKELTPEVRLKMKKNLVYIGIFSVIMLFAGFVSAYIVMMGDSFWVKVPLPSGFWISTTLIVISSLTFILAIRSVKNGNQSGLKLFMSLTLILGLAFAYFQFQGYKQLMAAGIHPMNNHVIVTDGRYGDYFDVKMDGSFIEVDGNKFMKKGKEISASEMKSFQNFMSQFNTLDKEKPFTVDNYAKPFILYFENTPVGLIDGRLKKEDGTEFSFIDRLRLHQLALNVRDARGDFFARGEMGKDFNIYYKGSALEYEDRIMKYEGQPLDNYLQLKATETADTASSFLFIISFLHLLHVVVTIFYLAKITTRSFSGRFTATNHDSLLSGSIFWHFLGVLWVFLLLFLLFIH